jgi:hypothetical protein
MDRDLDPVFDTDRDGGSTPPESGEQSGNVVGRPIAAHEHAIGFHDRAETSDVEREAMSEGEALREGGSFDGLGALPDRGSARRAERTGFDEVES